MPITFPHEDHIIVELHQHLSGHFDFAQRLLRYWLASDKDTGLARSALSPIVLRVLLAMNVKACRQFRSVIELCGRGESADGSIIARAMFETALVIGFVLKKTFVPREFNRLGKVTRTIAVPGVALTREFRATLFVTHHVLQPEREASMHQDRPGMKRHARRMTKLASLGSLAKPFKDFIGADWTNILLKRPQTYSGLSIGNLARSLGKPFPQWYDQVYGAQSEHVHSVDLLHHMQMDDAATTTPQWQQPIEHVRRTLQTAIAMFSMNIGMLDSHIEFGIAMTTAISGFAHEYNQLILRE